jgi:hypothetical protein
MEFRVEAFNLTNTPVFGQPNSTVNAPNVGVITATRGIPRQLQIALKVRILSLYLTDVSFDECRPWPSGQRQRLRALVRGATEGCEGPEIRPSRWQTTGRSLTVVEVKGSHTVYVSQPRAVSHLIRKRATGALASDEDSLSAASGSFSPPAWY